MTREQRKKRTQIGVSIIVAVFVCLAFYLVKVQIIDGKEYDLDGEFCHDDIEATAALCAIDCLIADLENYDEETILKNIEKRINTRNKE